MDRLMRYINASVEELRAVRWPTRRQAVKLSSIVIGFTAACGLFFGAVDFLFAEAMRVLLANAPL